MHTQRCFHTEKPLQRTVLLWACVFTHWSFFLHKGVFTHRCVQKLLHTVFYTQMRLQIEAFTHRSIYMHRYLYTTKFLHTETFTRRIICGDWQEQWHTCAFNQRCLYTQKLFHKSLDTRKFWHTQVSLLRKHVFYTEKALQTEGFKTHVFYTRNLLHTDAFTQGRFLN